MKKRKIITFFLVCVVAFYLAGCTNITSASRITKKSTTKTVTNSGNTNNSDTNKTTIITSENTSSKTTTKKTNKTTKGNTTTAKETEEITVLKDYSLTVYNSITEAGTTTTYSKEKFTEGSLVSLTTKANDGYYFICWKNASTNEVLSENTNYSFKMPSNNLAIKAEFSFVTLTTKNDERLGEITILKNEKYSPGSSVTITCTPDEEIAFDGWYDNETNQLLSRDATYTFTMPKKNITYVAKYSYCTVHLGKDFYFYHSDAYYTSPASTEGCREEYLYKRKMGDEIGISMFTRGRVRLHGYFDENDNLISSENDFTITVDKKDIYIFAKYEMEVAFRKDAQQCSKEAFHITYKEKDADEFSEVGDYLHLWLKYGKEYTIKVDDIEGVDFRYWRDFYASDPIFTYEHEYTFTMNLDLHYFYPYFTKTIQFFYQDDLPYSQAHCTVQVKSSRWTDDYYEDINPDGTYVAEYLELYYRRAIADDGYEFDCWAIEGRYSSIMSNECDFYIDPNYSNNGLKYLHIYVNKIEE